MSGIFDPAIFDKGVFDSAILGVGPGFNLFDPRARKAKEERERAEVADKAELRQQLADLVLGIAPAIVAAEPDPAPVILERAIPLMPATDLEAELREIVQMYLAWLEQEEEETAIMLLAA
jgi:hypothetical protein